MESASVKKQAITPHLWFDKEAKEATAFYASTFQNSKVTNVTTIRDTPSGDCDIVSFELLGQPFMAISAGPFFKFNPSISFFVACDAKEEVDAVWARLIEGGKPLMELGSYPFNERYGWLQDKYGLSWQIGLAQAGVKRQKITPTLMFVGGVYGKAEEAIRFYTSVFQNAKVGAALRRGKGEEPGGEGTLRYSSFTLAGQEFAAMDSGYEHGFGFNEAVSFMVSCATQDEIDYYWERLSAVPEAEQCGWLKDRYGVSWQIVPAVMGKMMQDKDERKIARVTKAFLGMKKFNIAELERAYEGKQKSG